MTTPRKLSARYELGEILGFGGMSEVHLARDVRLSRDVAIKVLRADLARDPTFYLRFKREAQNAAALNHPAIVAVYDTGEAETDGGPLPYIVMEYVDGETLRDLVRSKGPLQPRRAMEIIADVCAALDFSHKNGIVHRDMKPANIMINRSGAVKVMDFGIARAISDSSSPMTQTAAVIGTAQYLSPEQARGEQVDARSDVYSVGCVLFEILTGEPPFTGDSPVSVAYQHVREEPRRPSDVYEGVPYELDAVILKAMSKNPANRYQSAAEMRSDLVRVLGGQKPIAPVVMTDEDRSNFMSPSSGAHRHRAGAPRRPGGGYHEDGSSNRGRIIGISVAAVVVAAVVAAFVWVVGPWGHAEEITVPSVTSLSAADAQSTLEKAGFKVFVQRKADQTVATGSAIDTKPGSGSQATKGSTVTLDVSLGPQQIRVPRLAGLTQSQAQQQLENDNLQLGTVSRGDSSIADKDHVVKQDPPEAGDVDPGTAINITLGQGPKNMQLPDVTGQQVADAVAALQNDGITVQQQQVPASQPKGTVVQMDPKPGTTVSPSQTITLYVSSGVAMTMPDLTGETVDQAYATLEEEGWAGSHSQIAVKVQHTLGGSGTITNQLPAAGSPLGRNDSISVIVSEFGLGN